MPGPRPSLPCVRCGRHHRNWNIAAKCRWRALWVCGRGPWASVSFCPRGTTVQLYETQLEAVEAKQAIDRGSCGGACIRQHYVKYLGP